MNIWTYMNEVILMRFVGNISIRDGDSPLESLEFTSLLFVQYNPQSDIV